jgi:hypothetical protein
MGEPLNEHVLDELLSADLDGELAAAAADLGLTLEAAEAAVASPAAVARRSELARTSELVGAAVPLEPEVVSRLVTVSIARSAEDDEVGAARRRRERRSRTAWRVVVAAGSAAAVITVIVGLATMSSTSSDNDMASSGAPIERSDQRAAADRPPLEFGDVSRSEKLRRSVRGKLQAPTPASSKPTEVASSSGATAPGYANDSAFQRSAAACLPAARDRADGATPVLTGRGTSGGRPVNVYVFRSGNAYDVVVVGTDCSVVDRLALP